MKYITSKAGTEIILFDNNFCLNNNIFINFYFRKSLSLTYISIFIKKLYTLLNILCFDNIINIIYFITSATDQK